MPISAPDTVRDRADLYHAQLCRVAYLAGFYEARARHTGNPDLAELVRQLTDVVSQHPTAP
jgi:hypothetical protein